MREWRLLLPILFVSLSMMKTAMARMAPTSVPTDAQISIIQQTLGLADVSRDALRPVLQSDASTGVDYLSVANDVVTGLDIANKVRGGDYDAAWKIGGEWTAKGALAAADMGGIATIWTASEASVTILNYLGRTMIYDPGVSTIISRYVQMRRNGDSDADAWDGDFGVANSGTVLWPPPYIPLNETGNTKYYDQRVAEMKSQVHKQALQAWTIYSAQPHAEGDKEKLSGTLRRLVSQHRKAPQSTPGVRPNGGQSGSVGVPNDPANRTEKRAETDTERFDASAGKDEADAISLANKAYAKAKADLDKAKKDAKRAEVKAKDDAKKAKEAVKRTETKAKVGAVKADGKRPPSLQMKVRLNSGQPNSVKPNAEKPKSAMNAGETKAKAGAARMKMTVGKEAGRAKPDTEKIKGAAKQAEDKVKVDADEVKKAAEAKAKADADKAKKEADALAKSKKAK